MVHAPGRHGDEDSRGRGCVNCSAECGRPWPWVRFSAALYVCGQCMLPGSWLRLNYVHAICLNEVRGMTLIKLAKYHMQKRCARLDQRSCLAGVRDQFL